ncbi:MAG: tetratricopeptide repeat protein [Chlorobiaceae bacterium]
MKPLIQVGHSYLALSQGEQQLRDALYEEASESYRRALEVSRSIPQEEAFDYDGFDALCHTGLSGAYVKLGRYAEALHSAEIGLRYFNRRGELHQDEGKQWIAAVLNRAQALDGTGQREEALKAYRIASEMIAERKGELPDKEELQRSIKEQVARLQPLMADKKPAGYKAWWEFWS